MDAWSEFGIVFIRALQTQGWLETPMRVFTFLGRQDFFVFALPIIYWCIDARLGIRVAFLLLIGHGISIFAKMALQGPRPYWVSPLVKGMTAEPSMGIPSSHAQLAVNVWGLIAAALRRPWAWAAAVVLIFLIGFSRLYLGAHFPHDVLFGWLLGGITLWLFLRWWGPLSDWVRKRTLRQQLLLSLVLPALLLVVNGLLVNAWRDYELPQAWTANAQIAGEPYPEPYTLDATLVSAGTLFGFCVGLALLARGGGFRPTGPAWRRLLCFVIGIVVVAALYLGLGAIFPDDGSLMAGALRFVRYALIGFWVAAGAPWVFRGLRLMRAN